MEILIALALPAMSILAFFQVSLSGLGPDNNLILFCLAAIVAELIVITVFLGGLVRLFRAVAGI